MSLLKVRRLLYSQAFIGKKYFNAQEDKADKKCDINSCLLF